MAKVYKTDELSEWFKTKALNAGPSSRNVLLNATDRLTDNGVVGNLYAFKYDPKTKDKLPMYDKFPLAIILELKPGGFLGLNLHYLSKGQRGAMLSIFDKYRNNYRLKENISAGTSVNWVNLMAELDGTGKEAIPRACLKRYLFSHCQSRFVEIRPDEYDKAIQLPIDLWVYKR